MDEVRKKVVVIDDNTSLVDVVSKFLVMNKFQVFTAYDGIEGIKIVSRYMPDIILLDIMMPGLTGYEVCERLKKVEKTKHIPIIFLSVRSRLEDIEKGYRLGATHYITKPFNYSELMNAITEVLAGESIQKEED